MDTFKSFASLLYTVNVANFADIALDLFRYQVRTNAVYSAYVSHLQIDINDVDALDKIPFLPISLFKTQVIKTGTWHAEQCFLSSGTTGTRSCHHIKDVQFYRQHAEKNFNYFFGELSDYNVVACLPSYEENKQSSLIIMMQHFIERSHAPASGFYAYDAGKLVHLLDSLKSDTRKTILWGVSYALLDLAETHACDLQHCMIFETGGMKGRRREMTREELHQVLCARFGVQQIYSEYGMTEVLSQCYASGNHFACPPWVRVQARDLTDPFSPVGLAQTGGLNIIDLANWHSVAFIETEDLGRIYANGTFEVLGRIDNSDVRGCNLLAG